MALSKDGGEDATARPIQRHHMLLEAETLDKAAEYLRLALQAISHARVPPIPLNYSLFYFSAAGIDVRLKEQLDAMLAQSEGWQHETACDLFQRFVAPLNDHSMSELQQELLVLINSIVESAVDASQSAHQRSEELGRHVDELAQCHDPKQALQIASQVLEETRHLVAESKAMASTMQVSAEEALALKEELTRARREASVDALTGLSNRRIFDAELSRLIAQGEPFTLVMMDIDHFKKINDQHGHLVGDRVLRLLAEQVTAKARVSDVVARYGGEEFAMLLPHTLLWEGKRLAEKMCHGISALNMRRSDNGSSLGRVTSSFGVAEYQRDEGTSQLVSRADAALYVAKQNGRNRVEVAA